MSYSLILQSNSLESDPSPQHEHLNWEEVPPFSYTAYGRMNKWRSRLEFSAISVREIIGEENFKNCKKIMLIFSKVSFFYWFVNMVPDKHSTVDYTLSNLEFENNGYQHSEIKEEYLFSAFWTGSRSGQPGNRLSDNQSVDPYFEKKFILRKTEFIEPHINIIDSIRRSDNPFDEDATDDKYASCLFHFRVVPLF